MVAAFCSIKIMPVELNMSLNKGHLNLKVDSFTLISVHTNGNVKILHDCGFRLNTLFDIRASSQLHFAEASCGQITMNNREH